MIENETMSRTYRDPIHQEITLNSADRVEDLLIRLIDTREMQRLRWIRQLGTGWLTYHGAEGSRFQHSLGTMHVARKMFEQLSDSLQDLSPEILERYKALVLVSALLHDVGHGPFSHSCEEVLEIRHEDFTQRIILDSSTAINKTLRSFDSSLPDEVSSVLNKTHPVKFLSNIVSSQIDADRFDYLLRDSHFTGTNYGNFDLARVISSITLNKEHDCLAVFNGKGRLAVEDYLYARYSMYLQVYLHKKCLASDVMFKKLFERVKLLLVSKKIAFLEQNLFNWLSKGMNMDIQDFIEIYDTTIWHHIKHWVHEKDNILKDLARRFLDRDLFKAYQFNNEEEFQSLKQNALAKLKLRDMNPEYYIDRISIAAKPYSFYNPDKTNFSKAIFVQDQDSGELREISEVSPIVNSMVKNNFQNQYLISI